MVISMMNVTTISIIKKTIDGVDLEVDVCGFADISECSIDGIRWYIQDVDLAQVIRGIASSETLYEFRDAVEGIWGDEEFQKYLTMVIGDE